MEAKETDKLFRDKLKNMPSAPKADSWDKLESMLDGQEKKPLFTLWRVVAAVLLFVVSGLMVFLFNNNEEQRLEEVVEVMEPSETIPDSHVIVPPEKPIEEIQKEQEVKPQIKEDKPQGEKPKQIQTQPEKVQVTEPIQAKEPITIEEQQLAKAEPLEVEEIPEKKKTKTIRITYKRGSQPLPKQEKMLAEHKADTTGGKKIKEVWEQTRDINPGDLWADIREAKDNLFQRNSKKNNVKNLNK